MEKRLSCGDSFPSDPSQTKTRQAAAVRSAIAVSNQQKESALVSGQVALKVEEGLICDELLHQRTCAYVPHLARWDISSRKDEQDLHWSL